MQVSWQLGEVRCVPRLAGGRGSLVTSRIEERRLFFLPDKGNDKPKSRPNLRRCHATTVPWVLKIGDLAGKKFEDEPKCREPRSGSQEPYVII